MKWSRSFVFHVITGISVNRTFGSRLWHFLHVKSRSFMFYISTWLRVKWSRSFMFHLISWLRVKWSRIFVFHSITWSSVKRSFSMRLCFILVGCFAARKRLLNGIIIKNVTFKSISYNTFIDELLLNNIILGHIWF